MAMRQPHSEGPKPQASSRQAGAQRPTLQAAKLAPPSFALVAQGPQVVAQKQLIDAANHAPRISTMQALGASIDNSPRLAAQRKLTAAVQNSPRVAQLRALGEVMNGCPAEALAPLQRQVEEDNTGLPGQLKAGVEALSGVSLDGVKVHYNSSKPAQLNALAYAQGTDIHLGPGQEQHLPHEAWHVVQQAQGRVKPTLQMKEGVPVNDDKDLEHEADVMGAKALGGVGQRAVQAKAAALSDS